VRARARRAPDRQAPAADRIRTGGPRVVAVGLEGQRGRDLAGLEEIVAGVGVERVVDRPGRRTGPEPEETAAGPRVLEVLGRVDREPALAHRPLELRLASALVERRATALRGRRGRARAERRDADHRRCQSCLHP